MISSYKTCLECGKEVYFVPDEVFLGASWMFYFGAFPKRDIAFTRHSKGKFLRRSANVATNKANIKKGYYKKTYEAICHCVYMKSHGPSRLSIDPKKTLNSKKKLRARKYKEL